jgi:hypothetical protein
MKFLNTKAPLARYCYVFALLLVCYLAFAFVACLLPGGAIRHHAARSVEYGDLHGDYPRAVLPLKQAQMDNFTDALIINQACCISRDSLWRCMMLLPRADYGVIDQTTNLQQMLQGEDGQHITYPRYWHGSTFFMRFLLALFAYPTIRLVLYFLSSLLLIWLLLWLWRLDGWVPVVAVSTAFTLMYGFVMQFSIQFFPVLALSLIGSLLVCKYLHEPTRVAVSLFVIGSLTAYFDLLTTPLLTVGLPLTLFCYLNGRAQQGLSLCNKSTSIGLNSNISAEKSRQQPFGKGLAQLTGLGAIWAVGFALTWFCKWLIASLSTPVNVFRDAFSKVSERAGGQSENVWELADFSRWSAITSNANFLPYKFLIIALIVLVVLAFIHYNKGGWKSSLLLLFLAALPYAWYFALANHSYQHWWFTYRNQIFTMTALLLAAANLVDWNKLCTKHNNIPKE